MAPIARRRRPSLVSLATAYADQSADDTLTIPEDLTALSDEDLAALATRAGEAFDGLYGDGTADLSTDDLATLASLTEGIEALAAEQATRESAAQERRDQAAALAARRQSLASEGTADEDAEDGAEGDGDEDGEGDGEDAEGEGDENADGADEETPDGVQASGRQTLSINLGRTRRRQPTQQRKPKQEAARTIKDVAFSADSTTGIAENTGIDFLDSGRMLANRLKTFSASAYAQAASRGQHMREQMPLMRFSREVPAELKASSTPESVEEAMKAAVDQSRLPGGALTAAGWCAPSENFYDLVYNESRDGMLSIPEVQVTRGGMNVPVNPTFADIYASVGFHFDEADAIAGRYANGSAPAARANTTAYVVGDVRTISGLPYRVVAAGTTAGAAPTTVPQVGHTVTDGTVTWVRLDRVPNAVGSKPCYEIECPEWQDYRLEGDGLCLTADILSVRGYPEMLARITNGALVAHDHKVNAGRISRLIAGSTAITMTTDTVGTTAPLLAAIELQVEHYRYSQRLSRSTLLEGVFPYWIHGAIRQDLSVRLGLALFDVTDAMIDGWFRLRGLVPQYVYDWQGLDGVAAGSRITWPSTVDFLLYQAGTWVGGVDDIITLDTLYDSTMLGENKFTALFTEEAWLVAKRNVDSRVVRVPVVSDGTVHAGVLLDGDLGPSA